MRNVVCPDQASTCQDGQTCCATTENTYDCCPKPGATCCSDGLHCCPSGYSCGPNNDHCYPSREITKVLKITTAETKPRAGKGDNTVCPDSGICPDDNTCCPVSGGRYGCCPKVDATCCSDMQHCCPQGYECSSKGSCYPSGKFHPIMKLI